MQLKPDPLSGVDAMLRRAIAFILASIAIAAILVVVSRFQPVSVKSETSKSIGMTSRTKIERFIRGDNAVSLPQASQSVFEISTDRRDISPKKNTGIFSGTWYGAFETSWFQPDGSDKIWFLAGEGSSRLWEYWESSRKIPYGAEHPDFDPSDDRPLDEWFWPYVCVRVEFSGTQEIYRIEPRPVHDVIYADTILSAHVVDLAPYECVKSLVLKRIGS